MRRGGYGSSHRDLLGGRRQHRTKTPPGDSPEAPLPSPARDLDRLKRALAGVEQHARSLRWADERPWRRSSHLWAEGPLPVVDLHDLDVKGTKQVIDAVVDVGDDLDAGALVLITGRGRRSIGPGKLSGVVRGRLGAKAGDRGWRLSPQGPGRFVLVIDPARAPASATGRLGWPFWLGGLLFGAAATVAWPPAGVLVLAFLGLAFWLQRRDQRAGRL